MNTLNGAVYEQQEKVNKQHEKTPEEATKRRNMIGVAGWSVGFKKPGFHKRRSANLFYKYIYAAKT